MRDTTSSAAASATSSLWNPVAVDDAGQTSMSAVEVTGMLSTITGD